MVHSHLSYIENISQISYSGNSLMQFLVRFFLWDSLKTPVRESGQQTWAEEESEL